MLKHCASGIRAVHDPADLHRQLLDDSRRLLSASRILKCLASNASETFSLSIRLHAWSHLSSLVCTLHSLIPSLIWSLDSCTLSVSLTTLPSQWSLANKSTLINSATTLHLVNQVSWSSKCFFLFYFTSAPAVSHIGTVSPTSPE